jgi:hypothetical protein
MPFDRDEALRAGVWTAVLAIAFLAVFMEKSTWWLG